MLLHAALLQQIHQSVRVFLKRCTLSAHPPDKRPECFHHTGTAVVAECKLFRIHLPRAVFPYLLPHMMSAHAGCQHIILQTVRLIHCQWKHPRAQTPEHALTLEIPLRHEQRATHKLQTGIQQNMSRLIEKCRHSVQRKNFFHIIIIGRKISRDHGNVMIPIALLPHKTADRTRGKMYLRRRCR